MREASSSQAGRQRRPHASSANHLHRCRSNSHARRRFWTPTGLTVGATPGLTPGVVVIGPCPLCQPTCRRSSGKTRASCRKTPAAVTPGFLPYALRASLRLFKFVPDEFVRMALLAHHAQEAVLEHAAAQERLELLAHVREQRAVLRLKKCHQIRVVRLHQRVQQRALGRMPRVGRRGRQRARCGAGNARRCASLQCGEAQHETRLYSDGCTVFRAASSPPTGVCPAHE